MGLIAEASHESLWPMQSRLLLISIFRSIRFSVPRSVDTQEQTRGTAKCAGVIIKPGDQIRYNHGASVIANHRWRAA
jgi:hypothetical protein